MANPVEITLHPDVSLHNVSRYLYSHFAEHLGRCIYGGIWVGTDAHIAHEDGIRLDTAAALRQLALPALRWPGGCFADSYHWLDGIGPRAQRPQRHNLWWRQPETNAFGTDEFMRFCRLIDAEPYICLNVGSGTVEEARSWVEYCNAAQPTEWVARRQRNGHPEPYHVRFWGIGNENWGCGGSMRPGYYADLYRRFATYIRMTAGDDAQLIAGISPEWDGQFLAAMKDALPLVDHLAVHIYSGQGTADVDFSDADYYRLLAAVEGMDQQLTRTIGLARAYSTPAHPIGVVLDEWGTWFREATVEAGLYQQSTMRDALFTAASFHLFHRHADGLWMTNMAQTVNVLQALVLTQGPQMIVTPTYHVYEMFRPHRDGQLLPTRVAGSPTLQLTEQSTCDAVSVSATRRGDAIFLSLVNLDLSHDITASLRLASGEEWRATEVRRLATGDVRAHNTFDERERVWPQKVGLDAGAGLAQVVLPAQSITTLQLARVTA